MPNFYLDKSNQGLKIDFMRKLVLLTFVLFIFLSNSYSQENSSDFLDNNDISETDSIDEEKTLDDFKYVGKAENLLMSSSVFYLNEEKFLGWRGMFDYYLIDRFSFVGVSHLPFENTNSMRLNFFGLGLNLHILKFTDIEFYLGGTAGFLWILCNQATNIITEALEFNTGLIYFGSVFFLKLEVTYRMSDAYVENLYYKLHQSFVSLGLGFKL